MKNQIHKIIKCGKSTENNNKLFRSISGPLFPPLNILFLRDLSLYNIILMIEIWSLKIIVYWHTFYQSISPLYIQQNSQHIKQPSQRPYPPPSALDLPNMAQRTASLTARPSTSQCSPPSIKPLHKAK